jgi:hypothetical protein
MWPITVGGGEVLFIVSMVHIQSRSLSTWALFQQRSVIGLLINPDLNFLVCKMERLIFAFRLLEELTNIEGKSKVN